nr:delta(8)-fatty-acid desaturase [Tanacetum cinerariifolium]
MNLAGQDVTDAFIAFHPGSAWQHLNELFTGYHLKDYQVSEVSKDYRKLASEFAKAGMFEKKGHGVIYSLCFVSLLLSACVYGVLYSTSFWVHMMAGAVLGLAWMQIAYLGHDAGHYQMMATRGWNKFAVLNSTADGKKYITSEELQKHNKASDLWISIQGKVYNVTEWAKIHPGGDIPLMNLAGQDVTDAFIAFHPGSAWQQLFTGYHLKDYQVSEVSKDYRKLASEFAKAGSLKVTKSVF